MEDGKLLSAIQKKVLKSNEAMPSSAPTPSPIICFPCSPHISLHFFLLYPLTLQQQTKNRSKRRNKGLSDFMNSPLIKGLEKKKNQQPWRNHILFIFTCVVATILVGGDIVGRYWRYYDGHQGKVVYSEKAVVAADDGRCSEVGVGILRKGGNAVDAAVAVALCLGVVNPSSSGIGGGGFMVVWSSNSSSAQAFDMRETAPAASSQNMYDDIPNSKSSGGMSVGVPGELAGLYEAWRIHGRLPWPALVRPAIDLANHGFPLSTFLGLRLKRYRDLILTDPGLSAIFAPDGHLALPGDICFNHVLGRTLHTVAEKGADAFYNGTLSQRLVEDVRNSGGILTANDLKNYRVRITDPINFDIMGHTILGMPPPSSGTLGLSLVLNILNSYGNPDAFNGPLGLHRMVEAMKHMFAIRMNLGDPQFVNNTEFESEMLSSSFAESLRFKIDDDHTFDSDYYMNRWGELRDHGTSHLCIVDEERNAVSMTSTVNFPFGSGILAPSVGVVLNNEMDDFSVPTDISSGNLPPSPANFIRPNKRPLSSMSPIIILKEKEVVGVVGASGGMKIIPTVIQVFINHFISGLDPLTAVESPRVYTKLIPNVVVYENLTLMDGHHVELSKEKVHFLEERGHILTGTSEVLSVCELVVQITQKLIKMGRRAGKNAQRGLLVGVSDPRKGGWAASM